MRKIEVVDYDPEWPKIFESLRSTIWTALRDVALSVEHVGSTSVPVWPPSLSSISALWFLRSQTCRRGSPVWRLWVTHTEVILALRDEKLSPIPMACPCTICTCVHVMALL